MGIRALATAWLWALLLLLAGARRARGYLRPSARPGRASGVRRGAAGDGGLEGVSLGIDLGTSNSAMATVVDGRPVIIPSAEGSPLTPSVLAFGVSKGGSVGVSVGEAAAQKLEKNENRDVSTERLALFSSVKRLMGRRLCDVEAGADRTSLLDLDGDSDQRSAVRLRCPPLKRSLRPEDLSALVLRKMLSDAAAFLGLSAQGGSIDRAVVTVPAYFDERARDATEEAAKLAGLSKVRLLAEPEAAALAYGLDRTDEEDELVLVFDLGGGTFDVSVLEVGGGTIEVLATAGDAQLGGDDFDDALAAALHDRALREGAIPASLFGSASLHRKLLKASEDAKIRLSNAKSVEVMLPTATAPLVVTRKDLRVACDGVLRRLLRPLREVALLSGVALLGDSALEAELDAMLQLEERELADDDSSGASRRRQKAGKARARMRRKQRSALKGMVGSAAANGEGARRFPEGRRLSRVLAVGGASRMPAVLRLMGAVTGAIVNTEVDPLTVVAAGAAVRAGMMDGVMDGYEVITPLQAAVLRAYAEDFYEEDEEDEAALDAAFAEAYAAAEEAGETGGEA